MSSFDVVKDDKGKPVLNADGKLLMKRITKKGSKKNYLGRVEGAGTGEFKLDLHFMGEEDLAKPVEFEKMEGVNAAVETFAVEPDTIFQTAIKGDRASFFVLNSKGQRLTLDRRDVHESQGVEWEDRRSSQGEL